MIEGIYSFLDSVFGPLIQAYHPIVVVTIAGAILGVFFTLMNYFLVDQEKTKLLQKKSKEFQKKYREAQASKDEKKLRKLQQEQMELMRLQSEVMKDTMFKVTLLTLPIFWIFFGWLRRWYVEVGIAKAPFNFFVFDWFHRMYHSGLPASELGYIGWYFLTSYAVGMILRKLLDMS
ncbi:DUF106 domain-containing protein [Thermococcus pacificus]|uniref:DUF106 domain-containing protein n=1 Tax=Thermococcus pacificus TaxID=71998 RepID=A0A218P730_9EURY|nr:DUF106 domain-containing protein [Thermococcus pacificus]ASJ06581.1 hypothetical protein A3L08_04175 [Thermococcus pacificus]